MQHFTLHRAMQQSLAKPIKSKPEPAYVRVQRLIVPETGEEVKGFIAASASDRERLKARKYSIGDLLRAEFKKPRNPGFHRFVHQLGTLVVQNVEGFEHFTAHQAIKRLQVESGVGCDEFLIDGDILYRVPQSLAFDSMDETVFQTVARGLSKYLCVRYWPSCTPEEIERMAEMVVEV